MKRLSLLLSALLLSQAALHAQDVQATLVDGATPNSVKLRLKNSGPSAMSGNLTSLRFSIRVPDQGANNPSITATSLMPNAGSITYPAPYTESSYRYYDVSVVLNGGNLISIPADGELDVFNIAFSNGSGSSTVELVAKAFSGPGTAGPNDATEYYAALDGAAISEDVNRFYDNGVNSTGLSNSANLSLIGLGGIVLPVSYTHIEARKDGSNAIVSWGTAQEKNNAGFDIERSADGKTFTKIGYERSHAVNGTSSEKLEYSFTDAQPLAGTNFYRLKQINIDGKAEYSKIVSVMFGHSDATKLYPNPIKDRAFVEAAGVKSIEVFSVSGQKLNVPVIYGASNHELTTKGLAEGNYIIRITTDAGVSNHKVMVQH